MATPEELRKIKRPPVRQDPSLMRSLGAATKMTVEGAAGMVKDGVVKTAEAFAAPQIAQGESQRLAGEAIRTGVSEFGQGFSDPRGQRPPAVVVPPDPAAEPGQAEAAMSATSQANDAVGPPAPVEQQGPSLPRPNKSPINQTVALGEAGPGSTMVRSDKSQRSAADMGVPEGGYILHGTGRQPRFVSPNGASFSMVPGEGYEGSLKLAKARDDGFQFLTDADVRQQNADSTRISSEAQAKNAQTNAFEAAAMARLPGFRKDGTLGLFNPDGSEAPFDPLVEELIAPESQYELETYSDALEGEQLVAFNPATAETINLSQRQKNEIGLAKVSALIAQGEDPDDAVEEVFEAYGIQVKLPD